MGSLCVHIIIYIQQKRGTVCSTSLVLGSGKPTINDIDTYVKIKKATANQLEHQHTTYELSNAERRRKIETPLFYENIKRELR